MKTNFLTLSNFPISYKSMKTEICKIYYTSTDAEEQTKNIKLMIYALEILGLVFNLCEFALC